MIFFNFKSKKDRTIENLQDDICYLNKQLNLIIDGIQDKREFTIVKESCDEVDGDFIIIRKISNIFINSITASNILIFGDDLLDWYCDIKAVKITETTTHKGIS